MIKPTIFIIIIILIYAFISFIVGLYGDKIFKPDNSIIDNAQCSAVFIAGVLPVRPHGTITRKSTGPLTLTNTHQNTQKQLVLLQRTPRLHRQEVYLPDRRNRRRNPPTQRRRSVLLLAATHLGGHLPPTVSELPQNQKQDLGSRQTRGSSDRFGLAYDTAVPHLVVKTG